MYALLDVATIITSIATIYIVKTLIKTKRRPIYGVYQRPKGFYWLKVAFLYGILSLRKWSNKRKAKKLSNDELHKQHSAIECPQKLSCDELAIDGIYFNCANKSGDHLVVGTARRRNKLLDGFFYLKINNENVGLLESPKLPDTSLRQDAGMDGFEAEGIRLTPIEPMKKWRIEYDGKMKRSGDPYETCDVKIDVLWTSTLPFFNFDVDMSAFGMAKCMAREQWSRDYFKTLETVHQTHYEQHGDIAGTAVINGKSYDINMSALRDHSFGLKRDWRFFRRYGIHFFATENGDRFNVGIVSMPICFSRLVIGYVYCAADKKLYPIDDCDLMLHQHGENGEPPLDYACSFIAGGKQYTMQVDVVDSPAFYISKDWETKVIERLCKFDVNGVKGWGAAEWAYRNINGRSLLQRNK